MKRAKHTLSHYRMVTANMGELFPLSCVPVLPGDTVQGNTSALVRVSPLNTPVMHPVSVRIHHFFVPNRIVWDGWEDFITGGSDGADASTPPVLPTSTAKKSMLTYLGVPPIAGVNVNALPVYAVNAIYNEYYRDQDLITERTSGDRAIMNCAWEKDYFSSARPWSQKGPDVTVPLGTQAPIYQEGVLDTTVYTQDALGSATTNRFNSNDPGNFLTRGLDGQANNVNLFADLTNATAANVNDWRAAFSLQRYQEARARYGSRFTEYLRYLGVTPSDARLQRPEFLGGGTARLNFSEVLQTGQNVTGGNTDGAGVGDLYGHGIAGARSNRFRKFFEEHGYVITMCSIRPKALYLNGIPREFLKTTKEDYYQKELVNLGQQEVYQAELYAENERDVFGYQDRYHEYRSHPSQVGQDFRDTLNAWHLGRELAANTVLNEDFVKCDPSRRIYQVTDTTVDTLWIMANNHLVARRLVPKKANPRIL